MFAIGLNAISPQDESVSVAGEMLASRHPAPDEMDAYERLLGDAMAGDPTLFAREDYVEEAWRIVDPVLKAARRSTNTSRKPGGRVRLSRESRRAAAGKTQS